MEQKALWTADELKQLKTLIDSGLTYSVIAEIMKHPRSMVAKKAHNHGLNVNYILAQRYRRGIETEEQAKAFLHSRGFAHIQRLGLRAAADYEATKEGVLYGIGVTYAGSTYLGIRASTLKRLCEKYKKVAFAVQTEHNWYLLEVRNT